jgi:hypothetical protein
LGHGFWATGVRFVIHHPGVKSERNYFPALKLWRAGVAATREEWPKGAFAGTGILMAAKRRKEREKRAVGRGFPGIGPIGPIGRMDESYGVRMGGAVDHGFRGNGARCVWGA